MMEEGRRQCELACGGHFCYFDTAEDDFNCWYDKSTTCKAYWRVSSMLLLRPTMILHLLPTEDMMILRRQSRFKLTSASSTCPRK